MSDTLKIVKQTNKTILFEEFTDRSDEEVPSLYDIIESSLASGTFNQDPFYRKIDDNLVVRSFDEFVKKFAPKVYEYETLVNGVPVFSYTTDKQEAAKFNARLVKIDGHPFYHMLVRMYSQKGDSNMSNLDFPEDKIKEMLTPRAQMEEVYDTRRKLRSLAIEYAKAKEEGKNAKPFAQGIYKCRQQIQEKFGSSPRALLALAITEGEKKIENLKKEIAASENAGSGESVSRAIGRLAFDKDGKLTVIEIPRDAGKTETAADAKALENQAVGKVLAIVEKDVRESGPADEFSQDLVISAYAPPVSAEVPSVPEMRESLAKLEANLEVYQDVYRQAQEAFIKALADAARKMLCVKVFFDHATVKGGSDGRFSAGLLVTNCKASKFLADDDVKKRFATVMERLGHAGEGKKTWLGILPDVKTESADDIEDIDDIDAPLPRGGETRKAKTVSNEVDITAALSVLKIMDDSGILTVFNFEPDKSNSFAGLSAEGVERMEDLLVDVDNSHAVLAYPNFTVMDEGTANIAGARIEVPAVYVSASYVATALIAASQDAAILEAKALGDRLIQGNACARVDLEDDALIKALPTKFNRELAYAWPSDIIPRIVKRNFGFVFCGDPKRDLKTKAPIQTSYILQARTLKEEDGKYQPVYRTLTQDFIDAYLREFSDGEYISEAKIPDMVKHFNAWINEGGSDKNVNKINVPLQNGEKIEVIEEDGNKIFMLTLKSGKVMIKKKIKTQKAGE